MVPRYRVGHAYKPQLRCPQLPMWVPNWTPLVYRRTANGVDNTQTIEHLQPTFSLPHLAAPTPFFNTHGKCHLPQWTF